MRPIVALGILLVGLNGAAPDPEYQDARRLAGENPSSSVRNEPSIGKADREFVLAVPPAHWFDKAHEPAEQAMAPPPLPTAARSEIDADEPASPSVDELCAALLTSAKDNGLPVTFFANLIWQESRLRHDAVSPVGAQGIAQFMPQVALEAGVGDPFDPRQAIPASARLLHVLREHFGNLGFAAAAYNAGGRRVGEWLGRRRPLPRETRNYVERVTGRSIEAWRKAPLADAKLTFARPLPCRELPAYVQLEQARLQRARQLEQTEAAKKSSAAHNLVAERKHGRNHGHVAGTGIIARNFHSKHDAAHRQHAPHEKRRIAQQQFALRLG